MIERSDGMTREFIMLPEFDRKWAEMGLTDKELKALQERNVKADIRYFKRLKRYYVKKLKEMGEVTP